MQAKVVIEIPDADIQGPWNARYHIIPIQR